MECSLCPRNCQARRTETENIGGFCKMPLTPVIARASLHFGEEPCISGTKGSGTVFFSGCNLRCVFCQNFEVSRGEKGKGVSYKRLAEIFRELEEKGAHNINLVTPSHFAFAIGEALKIYRPKIPIVYNSSGYDSLKALEMLSDKIDIYLFDLKYLNPQNSLKYSKARDYPSVALKAIEYACSVKKENIFDENGIMKSGVIIRHLLLPRATNEAIKVFQTVKEKFPSAYFSIMSQYVPLYEAKKYPEINRKVTKREYEKVLDRIFESGFENCYFQDLESSTEDLIPDFNLYGV